MRAADLFSAIPALGRGVSSRATSVVERKEEANKEDGLHEGAFYFVCCAVLGRKGEKKRQRGGNVYCVRYDKEHLSACL